MNNREYNRLPIFNEMVMQDGIPGTRKFRFKFPRNSESGREEIVELKRYNDKTTLRIYKERIQ